MPGTPGGGPSRGRPRPGNRKPGRGEGDGFDFGELGYLAPAVVGVVALGVAARRVHHNRQHRADEPFRRSSLARRIDRAYREDQPASPPSTGAAGHPDTANDEWVPLAVGPRAFQVGGKGRETVWLDLTAAAGVGFRGPGAHAALRAAWLTILLRLGEQPPGRIVIPEPDAITLLGTTRPDPVPEGLHVVADLDHALAALDAEITHRLAHPGTVSELPLVVLMLAEPPPSPGQAAELAAVLRAGHRLGVSALIGADWPSGATVDIDRGHVVTATRGHAVAHLRDAYLFHTPAAEALSLCPDIDDANQATANRATAGAADYDTTPEAPQARAVTDPIENTAPATADPTTASSAPNTPDHRPAGEPQHPDGESTGTEIPDHHTPAGAPTWAPVPAADQPAEATATAPEHREPSPAPPEDAAHPEPATPPATAAATAAASAASTTMAGDGPPPSAPGPTITTTPHDGDRTGRAGVSTGVLRLEILHTVRMTWAPADAADTPTPLGPPLNVTPSGPTLIQVLTKLALHRGGQRRAIIAAALFPDAHIDRPTNTLNTNFTRIRQFIHKATGGVIDELVRANEDGTCGLPTELFQVDYWEFLDAIDPQNTDTAPERARAYQRALAHYQGDLAENIHADWITEYRDNTLHKALKAAIDLAYELTDHHNDPETAITILDQALTFDPCQEPIYQHLIRLLAKLDRRDAAIQRYKTLKTELARLGLEPMPETTTLLKQQIRPAASTEHSR